MYLLQLKEKVDLSPTILQTCYTFTVVARLAPKWNMITRWLVQGEDIPPCYCRDSCCFNSPCRLRVLHYWQGTSVRYCFIVVASGSINAVLS